VSSYFGFYRGIVKDNRDVSGSYPYRGRLRIDVPQVYGSLLTTELPWAEPCLPILGGGRKEGKYSHGFIAIPPVGSSVWVGFEQGDPQHPIWFGSWFGHRDLGVEGREMGSEAIVDNRTGVGYPDLVVFKAPGPPTLLIPPPSGEPEVRMRGMYIRFVGEQRVEIVFHENYNYIELDGDAKRIRVNSKGWNVSVGAECLNIGTDDDPDGSGGNIDVVATPFRGGTEENPVVFGGDISIRGRRVVIRSDEEMTLRSDSEMVVYGKDSAKFASSNEGVIYGSAPKASGFDSH